MGDIISFANLGPGIYQVAAPDEIKAHTATVTLREDEHFWLERKNEKSGKDEAGKDLWVEVPRMLHTSTAGLLLQAEHIGARVVSRVVELDRQRIRVIATGWCLGADGLLEVIEKSKEYDLAAELMKAALKETKRVTSNRPDEKQSTALVKTATEETALALVAALPSYSKAKIMEARLEVQTHREALCRTKSENQVLRYFIQKRGGALKAKPGAGEVKVELTRYALVRKLNSDAVASAREALYGAPAQPRNAEPGLEPEEPPVEDGEVIDVEATDVSEGDAPAEDGFPTDEGEPEHAAPATQEQPALPGHHCESCNAPVTQRVVEYCHSEQAAAVFGGAVLCFKCQNAARKGGGQ